MSIWRVSYFSDTMCKVSVVISLIQYPWSILAMPETLKNWWPYDQAILVAYGDPSMRLHNVCHHTWAWWNLRDNSEIMPTVWPMVRKVFSQHLCCTSNIKISHIGFDTRVCMPGINLKEVLYMRTAPYNRKASASYLLSKLHILDHRLAMWI